MASAFALLLVSSAAWADAPSPIDRRFAAKASVGNTFEVKESQLALKHSSDPEIRAMARWMIKDHAAAQMKLDAAAAATGTDAGRMLDEDHEAMIVALSHLDGAAFDKAYVSDQLAAHRDTDQALRDFEVEGSDPALLAWTMKTLPAVDLHLMHFQALSGDAAPAM